MKPINQNFYAVVLAGGTGTRFWPLSRQDSPKQFLRILGDQSLFQSTIRRILPKIKPSHIVVVTNARYRRSIRKEVAGLSIPGQNFLFEPEGKNTAPAIAWSAFHLLKKNRNAVMAVLPSDHLILNQRSFHKCLSQAFRLAQKGFLVTMGIVPTRPDTGYGYLKIRKDDGRRAAVWRVEKFIEKPPLERAVFFLKEKRYLWNSGMFVWRCSEILAAYREHLPAVYHLFEKGVSERRIKTIWPKLPSISVDYGILEKAGHVATVPAPNLGWSDLGSWESLTDVLKKDGQGNFHRGEVISLDCNNTLILGQSPRLIAAIGLGNTIIVDTADALLVCRKDCSQQLREIVAALKRKGQSQYL